MGTPRRPPVGHHDPCYLCGRFRPKMTWDHIEPRGRRTNRNRNENLARACYDCNHEKASTPLIVFLARKRRFTFKADAERERIFAEVKQFKIERAVRNQLAKQKIEARRKKRQGGT